MEFTNIEVGDTVVVYRSDEWQEGTVINLMDDGRARVRSVDNGKTIWTVKPDEVVYGPDEEIPVEDVAESDDAETTTVTESTVEDDGWSKEILADGGQIITSPTGRQFFVMPPKAKALNGLDVEASYRTRGVQNTGFIERVWVDGVEDTSGVATCAACGEETSVRKFPTKNTEVRLNVHRKCNSDRLAGAKGVTRKRQEMAN